MKNYKKTKKRWQKISLITTFTSLASLVLSACNFLTIAEIIPPIVNVNKQNDKILYSQITQDNNSFKNVAPKEVLQQFLDTNTGAKILGTDFSNLLILNYIESLKEFDKINGSTIATRLLGAYNNENRSLDNEYNNIVRNAELTYPNNSKEQAKIIQNFLDNNGGNFARFKSINLMERLRAVFISSLLEQNFLNFEGQETISSSELDDTTNWNKLKFSNNALSDPIAVQYADFQQFLFEDWINNEVPIPVINILWKYADNSVATTNGTKILETIYNKDALAQHGVVLPEAASYRFPAFDNVSNTGNNTINKVQRFIDGYDSIIANNGLISQYNAFSDNTDGNFKVVKLNNLGTEDLSTQETAAILHTFNKLTGKSTDKINGIDLKDSFNKNDLLVNFLKDNTNSNNSGTTNTINKLGIPIYNNALFLNSAFNNQGMNKNYVMDLLDLYHSGAKTDGANASSVSNWTLLKDEKGAHVLTIDGTNKIKTNGSNTEQLKFLKEYFLWKGMQSKIGFTASNNASYDLIQELSNYLNSNFENIILRFLKEKYSKGWKIEWNKFLNSFNLKLDGASIGNTEKINGLLNNGFEGEIIASDNSTTSESTPIVKNDITSKINPTLFLGTYNPFLELTINGNNTNSKIISANKDLKMLLEKLTNLLMAEKYVNNIFLLRKKLVSNATDFLASSVIKYEENKQDYYPSLNNGLASKLPFEISFDYSKDATNYESYNQDNDGGFKDLEKVFLDKTNSILSSNFIDNNTPGKLKEFYDAYKTENETFWTKIDFVQNLNYQSETYKVASNKIHFGNIANSEHANLLLVSDLGLLAEVIFKNANGSNHIASLIRQNFYYEQVVKKYYDFAKAEVKTTDTTKPNSWSFSDSWTDSFKRNFALSFFSKTFQSENVKQIFGGYKLDDSNKAENEKKFINLLEKIHYQTNFVNSSNGIDLLNIETQRLFDTFITIDWLLKDDFSNLINYYFNTLKYGSAAAFVWLNQNRQTSVLNISFGNKKFEDNGVNDFEFHKNPTNLIDSPYLMSKKFVNVDNFNTSVNNWAFAKTPIDSSNTAKPNSTVGYKGFVTAENASAQTNEPVGSLLFANFQRAQLEAKSQGILFGWQDQKTLITHIENLLTVEALNAVINTLQSLFPHVSFDNALRSTVQDPAPNSKIIRIDLEQRKTALINIVYGYNFLYRLESSKVFQQSYENIYLKRQTTPNSNDTNFAINKPEVFQRYSGSLSNGINNAQNKYAIKNTTQDVNAYVAYLIQMNKSDVANLESFKTFLSKISADVLLQDVFRIAQESEIINLAKNTFVNADDFRKFVVYDQSVFDGLTVDWATIAKKK